MVLLFFQLLKYRIFCPLLLFLVRYHVNYIWILLYVMRNIFFATFQILCSKFSIYIAVCPSVCIFVLILLRVCSASGTCFYQFWKVGTIISSNMFFSLCIVPPVLQLCIKSFNHIHFNTLSCFSVYIIFIDLPSSFFII